MPRSPDQPPPWPHAPTHLLDASGTYFITAATHLKQHFFRDPARLDVLHRGLLTITHQFGWRLEAWAVFSNHYHFIAKTPPEAENAESLPKMIRALHGPCPGGSTSSTARQIAKSGTTTRKPCSHSRPRTSHD